MIISFNVCHIIRACGFGKVVRVIGWVTVGSMLRFAKYRRQIFKTSVSSNLEEDECRVTPIFGSKVKFCFHCGTQARLVVHNYVSLASRETFFPPQ